MNHHIIWWKKLLAYSVIKSYFYNFPVNLTTNFSGSFINISPRRTGRRGRISLRFLRGSFCQRIPGHYSRTPLQMAKTEFRLGRKTLNSQMWNLLRKCVALGNELSSYKKAQKTARDLLCNLQRLFCSGTDKIWEFGRSVILSMWKMPTG